MSGKNKQKEKQKLKTSREVYDRILWDPQFNQKEFTIILEDHVSKPGTKEVAFPNFQPSDVPWHRIIQFKKGDFLVWDRVERIDHVFGSGEPSQTRPLLKGIPASESTPSKKEVEVKPSKLNDLFTYQYSEREQVWIEIEGNSEYKYPIKILRAVSFNVLFDLYDQDKIQTKKRIPALLKIIKDANADLIALQEVTHSFIKVLLQEQWIRKEYYISESIDGETIDPYGQVLLSKYPFQGMVYQYTKHKRAIVGKFRFNGMPFLVSTVHLTSNRAENADQIRSYQLRILFKWLSSFATEHELDCLILGDFNAGEQDGDVQKQQALFDQYELQDLWKHLHPKKEGYTFNPQTNPLAALVSRTQEPKRLDRIFLRSQFSHWTPLKIEMLGTNALPPDQNDCEELSLLHPSDHFGLFCELQFQERKKKKAVTTGLKTPPVYQSAVVIIPPVELWSSIQAIRCQYDKGFVRWMPHINLLYGFVPDLYFEDAAELLAQHLKNTNPFSISFKEFSHFQHGRSDTLWLRPEVHPVDALQQLQKTLEKVFPQCNEQGKKSDKGFTPHLSVGQCKKNKQGSKTQALLRAWQKDWKPLQFQMEEVVLISRKNDDPFDIRYRIPLKN